MKLLSVLFILSTIGAYGQQASIQKILKVKETCRTVSCIRYDYDDNGYCSSSLFLNSDSSFLMENGCENRSKIILGYWNILNDTIELTPIERQEIKPICALEMRQEPNKKKATFLILDNIGNPVSGFVIVASKKDFDYSEKSLLELYDMQDSKEVFVYETDTNGIAKVDLTNIDSIEFFSLNFLESNTYKFPKTLISSEIKVTLNFNRMALERSILEYDSMNIDPIRYEISTDKQTIGYMKRSQASE